MEPLDRFDKVWLTIAVTFLVILSFIAGIGVARAHSWYPPACCSGSDCRSVPAEDLEEQADGCWLYKPNGAKFCKKQIRPSEDKDWHVCYGDANQYSEAPTDTPVPIPYCVFIQMGT